MKFSLTIIAFVAWFAFLSVAVTAALYYIGLPLLSHLWEAGKCYGNRDMASAAIFGLGMGAIIFGVLWK